MDVGGGIAHHTRCAQNCSDVSGIAINRPLRCSTTNFKQRNSQHTGSMASVAFSQFGQHIKSILENAKILRKRLILTLLPHGYSLNQP